MGRGGLRDGSLPYAFLWMWVRGEFLRILLSLIGSGYSCELIWIFSQWETAKSEVTQASVGR
jgi:hypothetical protein